MLTNSSILPGQTPLLWVMRPNGTTHCMYAAWPKQMEFHTCTAKNAIYIGSRGTGKSICGRHDAHMRAMAYPNYVYCILRRKHTELLKTHVQFISDEMDMLGGHWNDTKKIAYYPNGSLGYYAHAEDENSVGNLLGSQFYYMFFDELTTFPWPLFRKLATSCRVPKRSGLTALVRAATNPLGPSAPSIRAYFDDHKVDFANDPDYVPTDWVAIHTLLDDNPSIDATEYRKQFSGLPAHVRKAWLEGEYVLEGAYFDDWSPTQDGKPWHVIDQLPTVDGKPLLDQPWVSIYRAVDWGYWPDPAVCLWIAVLPSKHAIVFKERTWYKTLAATVAKDIVRESAGMRCIETFCDPTMKIKDGATVFSIAELFEINGVPVTASVNDRTTFGYAIHDFLNTLIDGRPKIQVLRPTAASPGLGCPELIRSLPQMQMDPKDPARLADSDDDHWPISLAYFCMGIAAPAQRPDQPSALRKWQRPKPRARLTTTSPY